MPPSPRLVTIPFSHYCEKARWAADHLRAPYVEEAYIPGGHLRAVSKEGGRTVPILVTDVE
ncbi:MAG: glutathione S-transferase N-terminal domain-containing protein, partial [Polyangiaceae bacterium]